MTRDDEGKSSEEPDDKRTKTADRTLRVQEGGASNEARASDQRTFIRKCPRIGPSFRASNEGRRGQDSRYGVYVQLHFVMVGDHHHCQHRRRGYSRSSIFKVALQLDRLHLIRYIIAAGKRYGRTAWRGARRRLVASRKRQSPSECQVTRIESKRCVSRVFHPDN